MGCVLILRDVTKGTNLRILQSLDIKPPHEHKKRTVASQSTLPFLLIKEKN